jgi:hypothetical protein
VAVNGFIPSFDWFYRPQCSVLLNRNFENELNCGWAGGCRGNVACYLPIMAANSRLMDVWDYGPNNVVRCPVC